VKSGRHHQTRRLLGIAIGLGLASAAPAAADSPDPPVHPGPQASPPGPPPPSPPPLALDDRGRRAIRGCPVDQDCHQELLRGLREFEAAAFPRPGSRSPWLDPDDRRGHNAVRVHRRSAEGPGVRRPRRPSELRADLRWLDRAVLPDLPVVWDERLIDYLEFYKNDPRGRNIIGHWLRRMGRYRHLMVRELRRAGLPEDLVYVAMIESSFNPNEISHAGAVGLWQFMPAGGSIYGLEQGPWVDDRRDPERSTAAAALYFADLYQRFGDWHLALAAYNAGYGAVLSSMAKYNTNDYWQLVQYENGLPWGTSLYVAKALACAIVSKNRELFGFGDLAPDSPLEWDHVTVPTSVPLAVIARAAGVNLEQVAGLNPQLRRDRTPPGVSSYVVRIPKGRARLFSERFPQLRGEWDDHDAYVARHGERFEDIARVHGISRSALARMNGVSTEHDVHGGMVLVVPRVSEEQKRKNLEAARADLYSSGVPRGNPGDKLLVPLPDPDLEVPGKRRVYYRVVVGDTLYGVARAFGVDRHALAAWNGLEAEAHLAPRMVLAVFVDPGFDAAAAEIALLEPDRLAVVRSGSPEHLDLAEERMGRRRLLYQAKKRESFEEIGARYGLSARDLARINRRPGNTVLEPGETALVYQVVDASESDRAREQAKRARKAQPKRQAGPSAKPGRGGAKKR
jgi:membrane-bound lytic murein transglycosylase D